MGKKISKLKMRRARSNEFESEINSKSKLKKVNAISPKVSPRKSAKISPRKPKKNLQLNATEDELPKRSKSSIHLQSKKKLKKRNSVSPKKTAKASPKKKVVKEEETKTLSVQKWLNKIGLPQYEQLFIENGLDDMMFVKNIKNGEILKEIGIAKIGHRYHIVAEIEKLNALEIETVYD